MKVPSWRALGGAKVTRPIRNGADFNCRGAGRNYLRYERNACNPTIAIFLVKLPRLDYYSPATIIDKA
eukprot:11196375-Lingulodinium_polyedra.AAC.1